MTNVCQATLVIHWLCHMVIVSNVHAIHRVRNKPNTAYRSVINSLATVAANRMSLVAIVMNVKMATTTSSPATGAKTVIVIQSVASIHHVNNTPVNATVNQASPGKNPQSHFIYLSTKTKKLTDENL